MSMTRDTREGTGWAVRGCIILYTNTSSSTPFFLSGWPIFLIRMEVAETEGKRERGRERERQKQGEKDRGTERQRETETETERERDRERERE